MGQFDVYRMRRGDVVDILQHDACCDFGTRIVAPPYDGRGAKLATSLNPVLRHAGSEWVPGTHLMSVAAVSDFTGKLGSVAQQDSAIKRAIDQPFLGI